MREKKKKSETNVKMGFTLPADLGELLRTYCDATGIGISAAITRAIMAYLPTMREETCKCRDWRLGIEDAQGGAR